MRICDPYPIPVRKADLGYACYSKCWKYRGEVSQGLAGELAWTNLCDPWLPIRDGAYNSKADLSGTDLRLICIHTHCSFHVSILKSYPFNSASVLLWNKGILAIKNTCWSHLLQNHHLKQTLQSFLHREKFWGKHLSFLFPINGSWGSRATKTIVYLPFSNFVFQIVEIKQILWSFVAIWRFPPWYQRWWFIFIASSMTPILAGWNFLFAFFIFQRTSYLSL